LFVDTSAIIAMMLREDGAKELGHRLEASSVRFTSPLVVVEATMVLSTRMEAEPLVAEQNLVGFLAVAGIEVISIDAADARTAVEAFAHYGKGRHPAKLNLADCLSYACAKNRGLPLLYKGDDFARTDLAYAAP
jgi:ribonuclease VapC